MEKENEKKVQRTGRAKWKKGGKEGRKEERTGDESNKRSQGWVKEEKGKIVEV